MLDFVLASNLCGSPTSSGRDVCLMMFEQEPQVLPILQKTMGSTYQEDFHKLIGTIYGTICGIFRFPTVLRDRTPSTRPYWNDLSSEEHDMHREGGEKTAPSVTNSPETKPLSRTFQ